MQSGTFSTLITMQSIKPYLVSLDSQDRVAMGARLVLSTASCATRAKLVTARVQQLVVMNEFTFCVRALLSYLVDAVSAQL